MKKPLRINELEKEYLKNLGARIKSMRIKSGYHSQEVFAYECGIPRAQYARYEKGTNMTFSSIMKIVRFHKMTFSEFFSEGIDL